jgi:hypothetical protein
MWVAELQSVLHVRFSNRVLPQAIALQGSPRPVLAAISAARCADRPSSNDLRSSICGRHLHEPARFRRSHRRLPSSRSRPSHRPTIFQVLSTASNVAAAPQRTRNSSRVFKIEIRHHMAEEGARSTRAPAITRLLHHQSLAANQDYTAVENTRTQGP